jgi:BirA family biotin operon repressor/biotin-[acetyl-CoA-carboxylase] ligase
MNTAQKVLAYLHGHTDTYVSGQLLAENLSVSRSAVWKAIEHLRDEGHVIDAVTNRGYRLVSASDFLDRERLGALLPDLDLRLFDTIDSTNRFAKQLAAEGASHGTLVVSSAQSQGRGRLGRSFSSPKGGLYQSMVLRPRCKTEDALLITSAAAVAVARAVEEVCGIGLQVKWVNDLFLGGRKVCGILTEGVIDVESGSLSSLVVGIGVNVSTPSEAFDPSLRHLVASLYDGPATVPPSFDANLLSATIAKQLLRSCDLLPDRSFLDEYRRRSLVLGNRITVLRQGRGRPALAVGIDDDARLVVRYPDGSEEVLGSGEISIRLAVPDSI